MIIMIFGFIFFIFTALMEDCDPERAHLCQQQWSLPLFGVCEEGQIQAGGRDHHCKAANFHKPWAPHKTIWKLEKQKTQARGPWKKTIAPAKSAPDVLSCVLVLDHHTHGAEEELTLLVSSTSLHQMQWSCQLLTVHCSWSLQTAKIGVELTQAHGYCDEERTTSLIRSQDFPPIIQVHITIQIALVQTSLQE